MSQRDKGLKSIFVWKVHNLPEKHAPFLSMYFSQIQ